MRMACLTACFSTASWRRLRGAGCPGGPAHRDRTAAGSPLGAAAGLAHLCSARAGDQIHGPTELRRRLPEAKPGVVLCAAPHDLAAHALSPELAHVGANLESAVAGSIGEVAFALARSGCRSLRR